MKQKLSTVWKWDRGYHEEGEGYSELNDQDGNAVVRSCDGCAIIKDGPNVALIEAAPEMLERLKTIFSGQTCVCRLNRYVGKEPPCDTCQIGALIAKAEGRQ